MIYPDTKPNEWAKLYGLDLKSGKCLNCGAAQRFVKPFAHEQWRGLMSDHVQCGEEYRQSIAVNIDPKLMEAFFNYVKDTPHDPK